MKKIDWTGLESYTHEILRQVSASRWQPEYVVGFTRGGIVAATMLSQYLDCPLWALNVDRDRRDSETNCWMAEDAYNGKNILVISDFDGRGFDWLIKDWKSTCCPHSDKWDLVWNHTTRFALLVDRGVSRCEVDYSADCEYPTTGIQLPYNRWWDKK